MKYLLDNSAFARLATSDIVATALADRMAVGDVAICGVLELEAGVSARNGPDHKTLTSWLAVLPRVALDDADFRRAFEVQGMLAAVGKHRSALLPDLLLGACAERHRLAVLHYDHDFDVIAEVTGQPVQWVVERGRVD